MTGETGRFGYLFLFSGLILILGILGIVSSRHESRPSLSQGLLLQAILLTCIVGVAFRKFPGDLRIASVVIVVLLLIQSQRLFSTSQNEEPHEGED